MAKVLNIKKDEDITSVIERLWETSSNELVLAAPKGTEFLRNIIALKLLKREAERLGKEMVMLTVDEVGREMCKRVGIYSRASLPKGLELEEEDEEKEDRAEIEDNEEILKEVPLKKYESLLRTQIKKKRSNAHKSAVERLEDDDVKLKVKLEDTEAEEVEVKRDRSAVLSKSKTTKLKVEEDAVGTNKQDEEEKIIFSEEGEIDSEPITLNVRRGSESNAWADVQKKGFDRESFALRLQSQDQEDEEEEKFLRPKKKFRLPKLSFGFSSKKLLYGFIGAAVVMAGLALYFILPKAEIVVSARVESVNQDLALTADKSISKIDAKQGKIPAQLLKIDKKDSQEFTVTGERQLNEKAKGMITIYNEYSSSPQTLVATTRFVSEDGKTFRLTKTVTVPGAKVEEGNITASSISAEVVADQAGSDYNIGPSKFTIPGFQGSPKFNSFYGRSTQAMSGGVVGVAKVVTQEDIDKGEEQLSQKIFASLDQELGGQIDNNLKLLPEAVKKEVTSVESSVKAGSPADKFTLTVKANASLLLFSEKDISELAAQIIESAITDNKYVLKEKENLTYTQVEPDFAKGTLKFKVKAAEKVAWKIDAEGLKKTIAGRSENEVKQIFNEHQEVDKAKVLFWPFWVNSVPESPDKIKMEVQY